MGVVEMLGRFFDLVLLIGLSLGRLMILYFGLLRLIHENWLIGFDGRLVDFCLVNHLRGMLKLGVVVCVGLVLLNLGMNMMCLLILDLGTYKIKNFTVSFRVNKSGGSIGF